jgi:hypothetical protein
MGPKYLHEETNKWEALQNNNIIQKGVKDTTRFPQKLFIPQTTFCRTIIVPSPNNSEA